MHRRGVADGGAEQRAAEEQRDGGGVHQRQPVGGALVRPAGYLERQLTAQRSFYL